MWDVRVVLGYVFSSFAIMGIVSWIFCYLVFRWGCYGGRLRDKEIEDVALVLGFFFSAFLGRLGLGWCFCFYVFI